MKYQTVVVCLKCMNIVSLEFLIIEFYYTDMA